MYIISQLDPEGIFGLLIEEMYPEFQKERYRTLENWLTWAAKFKDYIGDEGHHFWRNKLKIPSFRWGGSGVF